MTINLYEMVVLVRPELSPQQAEDLLEAWRPVITEAQGRWEGLEYGGLRMTAYPVRRYKKAHYFLLCLACSADTLRELSRLMKLKVDVLRYLSIRVENLPELPSPLAQQREHHESRALGGHQGKKFHTPSAAPAETEARDTENDEK